MNRTTIYAKPARGIIRGRVKKRGFCPSCDTHVKLIGHWRPAECPNCTQKIDWSNPIKENYNE